MLVNDDPYTRYATILKEYLPLAESERLQPSESLNDLGLDSLNTVSLLLRLEEEFDISLPDEMLTAETFATVGSLWSVVSEHLACDDGPADPSRYDLTDDDRAIAVIGMAGRFPGAADVAELARNILGGVHSLTHLTDEELLESGISPDLVADPNYVKSRPILDDIKGFDAEFFGYNPREAKLADPQQRLFLECAWTALEQAGYATPGARGRVGVFGGGNLSTYAYDRFPMGVDSMEITPFELIVGNDKDALSTIISYKLNLTGPSVSVQTFCSTSGSALHLAVQSLRRGECEMALAGGVCIRVPDHIGYLYQQGGQESPDGFLRTFDADSQGGVFGDASAILVLKPLKAAVADRDTVLAVIRGTAMTNDGSMKFSYTAPSVIGQGDAVAGALADADVDPADVTYVEAHGTATELGDPIEVAGLTRGYGDVGKKQYCAIGSVKTNVGHLDRAAGATGLIKIIEALRAERIPALLHYKSPNPEIDFANSPFYPAATDLPWPRRAGRPRLAGLNSLGVGGTNIHVVVQEPLLPADRRDCPRRWQFLPVSGRTEAAAQQYSGRLAEHLAENPGADLGDTAFTLQAGRQVFTHRRVAIVDSVTGAAAAFADTTGAKGKLLGRADTANGRSAVFLIAGVGEHYEGMVAELYEQEPVFRAHLDECHRVLSEDSGLDVRTPLTTAGERDAAGDLARLMGRADSGGDRPMNRTEIAQPAVFAAEYALAKTLIDWGVEPTLLVGYSVGEYVAACLAGVLSLEDALRLVAHRARLIAEQPGGSMLAVGLSEDALHTRVPDLHERGLDVATLNGAQLVVAGPSEAVTELAELLRAERVACRELETTHAFHSRMLHAVAEPLTAWITENITLSAPALPYISNLTGKIATAELVTDPGYWAEHMCGTVRFTDCLTTVLEAGEPAFVEIGPGKSLGAMLRTHPGCGVERWPLIMSTLPGAADAVSGGLTLTTALAKLWLAGVALDWNAYHGLDGWTPGRVHLPTYPFQRKEHWYESGRPKQKAVRGGSVGAEHGSLAEQLDTLPRMAEERWLHLPVWRQTAPRAARGGEPAHWLIYTDPGSRTEADAVAARLAEAGHRTTFALLGTEFAADDDGYRLRPGSAEDTLAMLGALRAEQAVPTRVVHMWTVDTGGAAAGEVVQRGLHTLVALARTMQEIGADDWTLDVVVTGVHRLADDEPVHPDRATVVGPCRMIPVEYATATSRLIDFPAHQPIPVDALVEEMLAAPADRIVALRAGRRFVPTYDTLVDTPPTDEQVPIRDGGVYLVTGGLGGIGMAMAERLARHHRARLVLFGRTPVPPREQWDAVLAAPTTPEEVRRRLEGLRAVEAAGGQIELVAGDVSDVADVRRAVDAAIARFGELNGVLHAAGVPGVGLMQFKSNADMDRVLAPKVAGTLALAEALSGVDVDFLVLFSSIASATGALGQTDYCAANVFLDGFAQTDALPGTRVVSIGWGEWTWNGWTAGLAGYEPALREFLQKHREYIGISFDEGWRALRRVLAGRHPHVVVNTQDFAAVVDNSADYTMANIQAAAQSAKGADRGPRPELSTQFVAPQTQAERTIADIWSEALGLEKVGTQDNFFELGGTSLLGVGIMDSTRRALKLDELPAHVLYQAPTVGGLAAVVSGAPADTGTDAAERADRQRAGRARRRELQRSGRQS